MLIAVEDMYLEHFLRARDFLTQQGLKPRLVMGRPVSESDLKSVDAETGRPMPEELRRFFLELGDAFAFFPDVQLELPKRDKTFTIFPSDHEEVPLVGWDYMHLADFKIVNMYFRQDVEEAATKEISSPSRKLDPVVLRQEMERRKLWVPFYGYGSGGSYLCIDLGVTPHAVRVYNLASWLHSPKTWKLVLASSFVDFFEKWSKHHFLTPDGHWLGFSSRLYLEGVEAFDWDPKHFPLATG